ncbi:MAG TPA: FtsX-like permease family protein [Candidatus Saccharimonadales bacterium]
MSVVSRGAKNAFRNGLRTGAVMLILAISIGLSLSMLVANKAVEGRIAELKTEVDRTITINPAGSRGFEGGGEPLTAADLKTVKSASHVESASGFLSFMLQNEEDAANATVMGGPGGGGSRTSGNTNLESSIDAGTLGKRFNSSSSTSTTETMPDISMPVQGVATNGSTDENGDKYNITSGRALTSSDTYSALVGKALAEKNGLKVGSTFTAFDKTFTVVGIIDQGTEFDNAKVVLPLATVQELADQADEVSTIVAQADSIENLDLATAAIQKALGTDKADVTTAQDSTQQAIESLKSVQNISIIGFIASLAAGVLTVLMVMFVIVRERRREIGVLKAIGGSNRTIVTQFIVEAIVIVAIGGVVGLGAAFIGSGAVANALVSSSTTSSSETTSSDSFGAEAGPGAGGQRMRGGPISMEASGDKVKDAANLVGKVTTSIGPVTLLYGFLGMIAIAILGSAIPAWLIAKVRPAEVLRGE